MLENKLRYFLRNQQFVTLGIANFNGSPHVSPKLLLKYANKKLFLIDFLVASSYRNIKENNNVSVSTFDIEQVKGFHLYGQATIVQSGAEYESLLDEWVKRQNKMAADYICSKVGKRKNMLSLALTFVKAVKIYKIKIEKMEFVNAKGVLVVENMKA